jgi:hypothetical protein
MDRRHSRRVGVQLPVQVWGIDAYGQPFMDSALVNDMSSTGIVLQGIRRRIRAGEILDIRMGNDKAQFRVIWIGSPTTRQAGEMGLRKLTAHTFLPDSVLTHCSAAAGTC